MKRLSVPCLLVGGLVVLAVLFTPGTEETRAHSAASAPGGRGRDRVDFNPELEYRRIAEHAGATNGAAERRRLAARWVRADPRGALAFARGLENEEGAGFVRDLLREWALKAPDDALAWSLELGDAAERQSARATVCLVVAEGDPRRAVLCALEHHADADTGDTLLENLAMQWAAQEPGSVVEWVRDQPPGLWRDRLLARTAFVLAKSDPVAAAHQVAELAPGPLQNEAAMAVLHQWARKDLAAASRWAEAFPEAGLRERALGEIAGLRGHLAASGGD